MAFAPIDNPKIAIAVYVENAGSGGGASASIASLLMEKHIRGDIKKTWWNREEYVLEKKYLEGLERTITN